MIDIIRYVKIPSGAPQYMPKDRDIMCKYWDSPIQSFIGHETVYKRIGSNPEEVDIVFVDGAFDSVEIIKN